MEERLKKIHSKGYWRVNIRPTRFEKTCIPNLTECRQIIKTCQVRLRGWFYPHLDRNETVNGEDWVESGCDSMDKVEYWRFHQSGQFIHHFACIEDHTVDPKKVRMASITKLSSGRYLSIVSTLYRITEIFEFAARLSSKGVLSPAAEISISLVGTEGRQLSFSDHSRLLYDEYICGIPKMAFQETYREAELIARRSEFAMDTTTWIFTRFNWTTIPRSVLAEDQNRLLERRL